MIRKARYFVGDFENTIYPGQTETRVWAAACVEMYTEVVNVYGSIDELYKYLVSIKGNIVIYFHNLKYDGNFWVYFLLNTIKFKQAYTQDKEGSIKFLDNKEMLNNTFKYNISKTGEWYNITIKVKNKFIEIRDSLKLLPFSVKKLGEDFNTKHRKGCIEYVGDRDKEITEEEKEYIKNDVLVVKEALEIMFDDGHKKLTIGSCCLSEYKKIIDDGFTDYDYFFPRLDNLIDPVFGNVDEFIRKSYKGGWCYLNPDMSNKIINDGVTLDVNSLYPSVMHSESGCRYPVFKPIFWYGDYIPELNPNNYYFIRIKTRFYLKKGYLPFIQLKNNLFYNSNKCLTTSDYYDPKNNVYSRWAYKDGEKIDSICELTLTQEDFKLLKKHYILKDLKILGGCYFRTELGIFDKYIDKYKKIKQESTGAKRALAKLFLNNLYGKLASSTDSSFKVCYMNNDHLSYLDQKESNKRAGFIAAGSAITSYARCFTITAAQQNYHKGKGFIYADTDSIHCNLSVEEIKGVKIHDTNFCCWKLEKIWQRGWFVRQKTYIEQEGEDIDIKCAGMPESCKKIFKEKILNNPEAIKEFKIGYIIDGKLTAKKIKGGVILKETTFEIR